MGKPGETSTGRLRVSGLWEEQFTIPRHREWGPSGRAERGGERQGLSYPHPGMPMSKSFLRLWKSQRGKSWKGNCLFSCLSLEYQPTLAFFVFVKFFFMRFLQIRLLSTPGAGKGPATRHS